MQLQKTGLLLFITLFVAFLYTFLHEGGHALVGVWSGATITAFSVSFLDLGAHVEMTGNLTPAQTVLNNLAGAGLPLLVWLVFMGVAPKRTNLALEALKVVGSLIFLNTLLAWIVLPLLLWAGQALSDDVTNFIHNSGVQPLWVTSVAFSAYLGGWLLFTAKIDGLRHELDLFRRVEEPVITPAVRTTTLSVIALFAVCGFVAFSANGYKWTAARADPFQPPPGYQFVKTIDLSQAEYSQSVVHTFAIQEPTVVGLYLRVEDIRSDYFEVKLIGSNQYSHIIVHAEGYRAHRDGPRMEEVLQPGEYQCILTSQPSPGVLTIYTRERP